MKFFNKHAVIVGSTSPSNSLDSLMHKPYIHLTSFAIAVGLIALFSLHFSAEASEPRGEPVPAFSLPALLNPDTSFNSHVLKGKVSLLNLWASWCYACRSEIGMLMAIKKNYSIPIYGINIKDTPERAKSFLNSYGNPYITIGSDPEGYTGYSFQLQGIPTTVIIDANGLMRDVFIGAISEEDWNHTLLPKIQQYQNEQRDKLYTRSE